MEASEPAPRLPEAVPPEHEDEASSGGQAAGGGKKPHPRDGAKPAARSDGYATCVDRAYVQKEIRWAVKYQKPIITVYESESHRPGYFDYAKAAEKYAGTEWEFLLGIDAIRYQREQFLAEAMLKNIPAKAHGSVNVEPAASPINQPGAWGFFLSHHQALGGDQMKTLSLLFKEAGETAWYDNGKLDKSEAAMEEGVKHCKNFVLMLTADAASGAAGLQPKPKPDPVLAAGVEPEPEADTTVVRDVFVAFRESSAARGRLLQSRLCIPCGGLPTELPPDVRVLVLCCWTRKHHC